MKTLNALFLVMMIWLRIYGSAEAQIPQFNHLYLHGWTSNSGQIYNLGQWCNSKFSPSWKSGPQLYTYASDITFAGNYASVYNSFYSAHNEGEYIGTGYSAGGLMMRLLAQATATTDGGSGWINNFVDGFVTLDAPNNGARIAAHWQEWVCNSMLASIKIARGDMSFLAYGAYIVVIIWAPILVTVGSLVQTATGMALDLKPSSDFIANVNSTTALAQQEAGSRGWVAVSGDIEANSNGHRWRFPANQLGYDNNSINGAMDDYQAKIDAAHANAGYHDWKVNHLHGFWNAPARAWHRMRRNDYNACADGYGDMDDAWEWATANRGQSDGFIAQSSQEYHPNPSHPRIQITGNINHGGAISCGAATTGLGNGGPDGTQGANAVWHAMHDALGLFPHP